MVVGQGQTVRVPLLTRDVDGDAVTVRVAAPLAGLDAEIDAELAALVLHPSYDVSGSADLTLVLEDAGGEASTVAITVSVKPIGWIERLQWTTDGPEAREHAAFIVDPERGRVLLLGGSGYSPYLSPLDDLWQIDLATRVWTRLTPSGDVPAGGGSRRVAQVPGSATAYLFGGYGSGGQSHGELHRVSFDGDVVFTRMAQSPAPLARSLHAFAYDPTTERFVAFGGAGTFLHADTLSMKIVGDVAEWTEYGELSPSPTPRYGFFSGFDEESGRLIVFSGAQGRSSVDAASDTWVLDARSEPPRWERVLDGTEPGSPPGRRNGVSVFDPSGPRLFAFGGTADAATSEPGLFALDARPGHWTWRRLELADEPPVRSSGFGFHDPSSGRVFLGFGNTASGRFRDLAVLGH